MTKENLDGSGWGLGAGLVLGTILAVLSLSNWPFIAGRGLFSENAAIRNRGVSDQLGGPWRPPARQSLPTRQNLEDQARQQRSEALAASSSDVPPAEVLETPASAKSQNPPAVSRPGLMLVPLRPAPELAVEEPSSAPHSSAPVHSQNSLAGEEPKTLLNHARFLIKAGLAPMAAEPLSKVIREAPGTPIAREAQQTLDSLSRN